MMYKIGLFVPILSVFLGGIFGYGCSEHAPTSSLVSEVSESHSAPLQEQETAIIDGDEQKIRKALRMPYHTFSRRLGSHKISCSSTLVSKLPHYPIQRLEQSLTLRRDTKGNFSAEKNTNPQYGHEAIWVNQWLYARLRYSKFIKRQARSEEPEEITDKMYSFLPAYVELLDRFLAVKNEGKSKYQGREVLKVVFGLNPKPLTAAADDKPAKLWRRSMVVTFIEGHTLLDPKTGASLETTLNARWKFNPPAAGPIPANGIPSSIDEKTVGEMALSLTGRISEIGQVKPIIPPPAAETIDNPRRIRLEYERQMLTGERPIPDSPQGEF